MKAVKSKDSAIELLLRKALWKNGYRYKKNDKSIYGCPDISFNKLKVAIFVDSEFWHGKDWLNLKDSFKSNKEFWIKKIEGNIKRDKDVNQFLISKDWIVVRIWGREILTNLTSCLKRIEYIINNRKNNALYFNK